jgi:hypothetical protein
MEAADTTQEQPAPLTVNDAARLVYLSFRFSQRGGELQELFFHYMHLLHPAWRVSDGDLEQITAETTGRARRLLSNPRMHAVEKQSHEVAETTVRMELSNLGAYLDGQESVSMRERLEEPVGIEQRKEATAAYITRLLLEMDEEYLIKRNGRPRGEREKLRPDTLQDPFLSFIIHFALRGNETGHPFYTTLFADVRAVLQRLQHGERVFGNLEDELCRQLLLQVIGAYNITHPDSQVRMDLQPLSPRPS